MSRTFEAAGILWANISYARNLGPIVAFLDSSKIGGSHTAIPFRLG